jgi:thiol-disulfide isomerase/thioredoxin
MKRALVGITAALALGAGAASAAPRPGDAPRFVGPTLEGGTVDLAALRGHVVVVDLWATWCGPCRIEMPVIDAVGQAHRAQGVQVVALSADKPRDLGKARQIMAAFHFPSAVIAKAKVNDFGDPRALPQTYVLDRSGRVVAVFGLGQTFSRAGLEAAIATASGR